MTKMILIKMLVVFLLLEANLYASTLEEELLKYGESDLIVTDVEPAFEETTDSSTLNDSDPIVAESIDSLNESLLSNDSAVAVVDTYDISTDTMSLIIADSAVSDSVIVVEQAPDSVTQVLQSAVIEQAGEVNVGENLKGYRSPRRAMVMSLFVPGLGQAYGKKYWKTGLFAILETATIVGAVKLKKDSDSYTDRAHTLADSHFSVQRAETFMKELEEYAKGHPEYVGYTQQEIDKLIYANIYRAQSITQDEEKSALEGYIQAIHDDIYLMARDSMVVQGWDDATPYNPFAVGSEPFYNLSNTSMSISSSYLTLLNADTRFGSSDRRNEYVRLLDKSEKRSNQSSVMVVGIITNHIVSAIDAYITTNRYNKELMKEGADIFSRISVDNQLYFTENGNLTTGVSFSWHF